MTANLRHPQGRSPFLSTSASFRPATKAATPGLEQHFEWIAKETQAGVRVVVLRLKRVRNTDAVCMAVLDAFHERMHRANISVLLCGVRPDLMKVINSSGLMRRLGRNHVFV